MLRGFIWTIVIAYAMAGLGSASAYLLMHSQDELTHYTLSTGLVDFGLLWPFHIAELFSQT